MVHYKETERSQGLFLTIDLSEQLIPGTYERVKGMEWNER